MVARPTATTDQPLGAHRQHAGSAVAVNREQGHVGRVYDGPTDHDGTRGAGRPAMATRAHFEHGQTAQFTVVR